MKRAIFCLLLCLLLLPVQVIAESEVPQAPDELLEQDAEATFAILHTGDINGQMEKKGTAIGFPLLRALYDDTSRAYGTLLLDSGNALDEQYANKTIKLMNASGYTAAAIGTRDAALGIERLKELSAIADFPLLCANWLQMDGELLFDPYTIVEVDGVRVGIIGLISPEIAETYPEITENCNVYKPSAIANIYYEEMVEKGCTYFIALTSLGYDGDYTPRQLGQESPWLNLILDSNTETLLDMGELIADTNVVAFNLPTDFSAVGSLVVKQVDGQSVLTPAVLTADDLGSLTPSANVQTVADTDYSSAESTGGSSFQLPKGVILLLSLAVISGLTVLLVVFAMRKGANNQKK